MLGKRPHQIQRSTSMSQLRVPPGARTRPTSAFAHAKKDCVSQQNDSSPSMSTSKAAAGAYQSLQPNALEDAQNMEMKIEGAHNVNMVNVSVPPTTAHAHTHGYFKAPHVPLKVAGSSSPLIPKHTKVESFLDACFFCKRPLGHGRDIFMYRGDAAFCTEECRLRQISCDEKCSVSASQTTSSDSTVGNRKSTRVTTPTGAF